MLVGNQNTVSWSLFSPGNTLAALLANNFAEAGPTSIGVLMYAALVLMGITLLVNIIGALILQQTSKDIRGAR
jgi:phosphate transport system permease protein